MTENIKLEEKPLSNIFNYSDGNTLTSEQAARIGSGNGGWGGDGMEPRIAKLEADVGHIQTDLIDIKADMRDMKKELSQVAKLVARIDGKLNSKVNYQWFIGFLFGLATLIMHEEIFSLFK